MGACQSMSEADAAAKERNRLIEQENQDDFQKESKIIKLLLLGAGESGKSTVAKQMRIIHTSGYTDEERSEFREVIFSNIIQSMRVLCKAVPKLEIPVEDKVIQEYIETVQSTAAYASNFNLELVEKMKALWASEPIQEAFQQSNKFQLNDSAEYYFERLDDIAAEGYEPDEQDILRSRVKTTGIVETSFEVEDLKFLMMDVGGQRNERKKWIHCFDNVTALIFCASLTGYDQRLREDNTVNRMQESLTLFDEIINSKWFKNTSIILFLNKKDLFEKKIQHSDLQLCFDDYTDGADYDKAISFITKKFVDLNHPSNKKEVYPYVTCATDTQNVRKVFVAVKDIILQGLLDRSGF